MWLGKENESSEMNLFLVHNGIEHFLVRNARIADILQATFNLMEVEDAELQTPVNDSSAEGDVAS